MKTPQIAILGGGNRGADVYVKHLQAQGAEIAYLVEARPDRLMEIAERHHIPLERCFSHWDEFFDLGKVADAVVIATPDDQHVEPALKALALGYDVLLEKPICLNESELDVLLKAEAASTGNVTVCHVLRATPFFTEIKRVLDSGELGTLVGIQHAENVAYWHYAHSFVRGNWRASPPAAPFILAKSCHDLDLLRWFAASAPKTVSSTGQLHHFRPENAPSGAAKRCVDCELTDCPYDARSIYGSREAQQWPVTVLTAGGHSLQTALEQGRYGECVYLGLNNVVDHQAVTVVFAAGMPAQLTVSAFTHNNTRTLKLLGTHGELRGQMELGELQVYNFRTGEMRRWNVDTAGIHGGGDMALVAAWLAYLRGEAGVPTSLSESVDSHRMAFAAERARLQGKVIEMI